MGEKIKEVKGEPESDFVALRYHFLIDFPDFLLSLTLEISSSFSSVAESLPIMTLSLLSLSSWVPASADTLIFLFCVSEFLSYFFSPSLCCWYVVVCFFSPFAAK